MPTQTITITLDKIVEKMIGQIRARVFAEWGIEIDSTRVVTTKWRAMIFPVIQETGERFIEDLYAPPITELGQETVYANTELIPGLWAGYSKRLNVLVLRQTEFKADERA